MLTAQDVTNNLLPQLKMPVLIGWGTLDRIAPLYQAETMHRSFPSPSWTRSAGCGHMAPCNAPPHWGPRR